MDSTFADQALRFRSTSPLGFDESMISSVSTSLTQVIPSDLSVALLPPALKVRTIETTQFSDHSLRDIVSADVSAVFEESPVEKMFTTTFTLQAVNPGGDLRHLCSPNSEDRTLSRQDGSSQILSIGSFAASSCQMRGESR
jgi:hypothetical protein